MADLDPAAATAPEYPHRIERHRREAIRHGNRRWRVVVACATCSPARDRKPTARSRGGRATHESLNRNRGGGCWRVTSAQPPSMASDCVPKSPYAGPGDVSTCVGRRMSGRDRVGVEMVTSSAASGAAQPTTVLVFTTYFMGSPPGLIGVAAVEVRVGLEFHQAFRTAAGGTSVACIRNTPSVLSNAMKNANRMKPAGVIDGAVLQRRGDVGPQHAHFGGGACSQRSADPAPDRSPPTDPCVPRHAAG